MTISDNQQKNFASGPGVENKTSEYYNLSGKNPLKESTENLLQKKGSWRMVIFVVALILIGMWFWWNTIQIKSSSKDMQIITSAR